MKQRLNVKNQIHDLQKSEKGANHASVYNYFRPNVARLCHRQMRSSDTGLRSDLSQKSVATAGNSLHKSWAGGGIAQDFANFIDRRIQAMVKVHKGVSRP